MLYYAFVWFTSLSWENTYQKGLWNVKQRQKRICDGHNQNKRIWRTSFLYFAWDTISQYNVPESSKQKNEQIKPDENYCKEWRGLVTWAVINHFLRKATKVILRYYELLTSCLKSTVGESIFKTHFNRFHTVSATMLSPRRWCRYVWMWDGKR